MNRNELSTKFWNGCFIKAILLCTTILSSAGMAQVSMELKSGDPLVVNAMNGLNLRPHPNSGKVGVIPNGHIVYATGPARKHETGRYSTKESRWAPVKYQNESGDWMEGWILLKYASAVTKQLPAGAEGLPNFQNDPGSPSVVTQTTDPAIDDNSEAPTDKFLLSVHVRTRARIRSGPGLSNAIMGRLKDEDKVRVLGKPVGNWVPIKVEGTEKKGWMHVSLLETEGNLNPLEVARQHPVGSSDIEKRIDEYLDSQRTAGGVSVACDGSSECLSRNTELGRIDITSPSGFVRPVDGAINSDFGPRSDPMTGANSVHRAVDFAAPMSSNVRAIKTGRVISVETNCREGNSQCGGRWGNFVMIDHGSGLVSVYAHLSSVNVQPGDRINTASLIGKSGNTGRSTGPHFHLEVHENGVKKSPFNYIPRT